MNTNQNSNKFILLASPTKFKLKYRNKKGEIKTYGKVTQLDTLDGNAIVAYVFQDGENRPGIRRFNFDGIIEQTVTQ